jgi:long-chain fatty acid transport protein
MKKMEPNKSSLQLLVYAIIKSMKGVFLEKVFKNLTISILIITAVMLPLLSGNAYAGNGTRMLGFSARDSGMAGATTASPDDTSCLVKNPGGLVCSGNLINAEYMNILPHDVTMETQGVPVNFPVSLASVGRKQESNINYIPGGDAGISFRIPGTDKYPIAVGCGVFTMSGVALNYPSSRINGNLIANGVYDRMVQLMSMRIAPGIAAAFNDRISIGVAANIEVQGLKTDLAKHNLQETAGSGKWDFAPGAGFTAGLLYKFNEMLRLGASYESHTWMGHHYKYKDTLPYVDEPPVINVGMSFKPIRNFEITYDTRYIQWTDVKLARLRPVDGGFGLRDQWVFAMGGECTIKERLKLRAGYNYGRSQVRTSVVFANALMPVIMEHHFTAGFSYYITKDLSLDFVWERHFKNTETDDGSGDIYSMNGVGTKITGAADIISGGLSYRF